VQCALAHVALAAGSLPILYVLSAICCEATERFGAQNLYGASRGVARPAAACMRAPHFRARSPNSARSRQNRPQSSA
jgi:hypothetical protein